MVSADNLNHDVLEQILGFLSDNELPCAALVSKSFLAAAIPRMYKTISYRLRHSKGYNTGETMSPFAAVLAHPHLAVHIRHVDIRVVPHIKGHINPAFMKECREALKLCKNLMTVACTVPNVLAVLLPSLQEKPRLKDIRVHANLTTLQAQLLAKIKNLTSISIEFASWTVVHCLPSWMESLSNTLNTLVLYMISDLHEEAFGHSLKYLPNLHSLHVVGCSKVDHIVVFRHVSKTPLLENLSMTTLESARVHIQPPSLRHLKHLALDAQYTMQPSPTTSVLQSILVQLKHSMPSLLSFAIKLPDRKCMVGNQFITELIKSHAFTLRHLSFYDCGVSPESIEEICKSCIHLERLEVAIPMKDIIPFTRKLSLSNTLHTLVDVDNHIEHGVRPALTREDARHMMSLSNGLRKIVTTHRIWTGLLKTHGGIRLSLKERHAQSSTSLWFMSKD